MAEQSGERSRRWQAFLRERILIDDGVRDESQGLRVTRMVVGTGKITATVVDYTGVDRAGVECEVIVVMPEWDDGEWQHAVSLLSLQAIFAAQMLAGGFPNEIDETLLTEGLSLLPETNEPIGVSCSCCDVCDIELSSHRCVHVVSTFVHAGEMLAEDPWLLFLLRGRMRQQILRALRRARGNNGSGNGSATAGSTPQMIVGSSTTQDAISQNGESVTDADVHLLEDEVNNFWGSSRTQEQFRPHIIRPLADQILLRRLGPPAFSHGSAEVYDMLTSIYRRVTKSAMSLAYSEDRPTESAEGDSLNHE